MVNIIFNIHSELGTQHSKDMGAKLFPQTMGLGGAEPPPPPNQFTTKVE